MADSVRRRTRRTTRRGPALRARRRDERGSGGVEFLIVVVTIFFLFAVLLQYGIRMHADRLAQLAAREGAVAAARFDGTTATGRSTAAKYADGPAIRGASISASRTPTEARVSVTVQIVTILPLLGDPITSTATAPVERYVP